MIDPDWSGKSRSGSTCFVALAAQDCASDLRLKRNLIVLTAMVADDLEAARGGVSFARFFRTALGTTLRRHHVALVKDLLFLFGKKECLFTLNARIFDVRHIFCLLIY